MKSISKDKKKDVIAHVRGGVVQHVDVPQGVVVRVRDYDTDMADVNDDPSYYGQDDEGNFYMESTWEGK